MSMTAGAILAARMDVALPPSDAEINGAVALAAEIDTAVRKRIRWEQRPRDGRVPAP